MVHNLEMGEVASVIKAFSCSDCARYVCNAMHCHSTCGECCEIDFTTDEIVLSDDDSNFSVEILGCCGTRSTRS